MTDKKRPEAMAADHFGERTEMVARWYMVNRDGMATLCTDREDAEKEASDAQSVWPHMGPHRAVQLVEAADVEAMRAGYAAARLEIESLQARIKTMAEEHADELMVAHLDGRMRAAQPATAQQPAPSAAVASKAVRAAIRAANMQLVRTGDDEFMLVTLKQVTPQADTQPAPQQAAQEQAAWNSLTDEDRERAMKSMPDMLEGFLKKWGWLHFANAIENICREKNSPNSPASHGDALDAARYRWLREPRLAAGQGSITVELDDRANGHFSRSIFLAELDAAIDAARKQGANHD